MKLGSTTILRGAVILMGLMVLALCVLILPAIIREENSADGYSPIVWGMYFTTIPFYIAVYQTLKLLRFIDRGTAFSYASVKALKYIKYCAVAVGGFYTAAMPYIHFVADQDDAPGVIVFGLLFAFASFIIAVLAAVLQKLLQSAIAIKTENDLTV